MSTHPSAERVSSFARSHGLELMVREYPEEGARTAADAAAAVGCSIDQIVKSMIFTAAGRPEDIAENTAENTAEDIADGEPELVLALTAGSNTVDGDALANVAGASACRRATPEAVRASTGYAIGGVPPFGHAEQLRTWIDPHLLTFDEVWAAAGTPRHVFPIEPQRLLQLTAAVIADFTR